jgi:beta-lactamase class C
VVYSLYAPVVQAKTKKTFGEVMKERVFVPFGMKDASTDFDSFKNNPNKAFPHQRGKTSNTPLKLNDRYYETAPAAGVNASISDMAQFLLAISPKDDNLFSHEARSITFTPQIESPLKHSYYRSWGPLGTKHYALGWRIVQFRNRTIAQHSGYVSGYQAEIAVCYEEEVGIALLTNSPNSFFSSAIPEFLKLYFDKKDKEILAQNPPTANHK